MINTALFQALLENLLLVNVTNVTSKSKGLQAFQDRHCFHPDFQPMFTEESLRLLKDSAKEHTFYEINDHLGICLFLFYYQDSFWLIGPYVKHEYIEKDGELLLQNKHLSASFLIPFKLYYTSFPIMTVYQIQKTVEALISTFTPGEPSYAFRRLQGLSDNIQSNSEQVIYPPDHSNIYKRYEMENHFLYLITTGNVEKVSEVYHRMQLSAKNDQTLASVDINSQNALSSLSTLKALVRKAAENGGLSVIKIDEITQKYVQRILATMNYHEQSALTTQMILELTAAVRESRKNTAHCSTEVRDIINYITDNYSKELKLSELSEFFHWSPSAMERRFKEETNETIFSYLTKLRIQKAKELLKNTKSSIQDISLFVGYADNNYFVKVFKKETGVTPSLYRKTIKNQKSE